MNWSREKISSFAEVATGGTPSTDKREFWDGGTIPWLNSGDLNQGIVTKASNFITEEGYKSSSTRMMPPDTVLIALTGATTGLAAILKIEACANQSVTGIFPSEKHYPEFLYYFFRTQRKRILDAAWGGAQPHISQKYIKDYVVPLPPLADQIKIAIVLSKTESLIKQRKENIDLLNEFLKSTFLKMFFPFFQKANSRKLESLCTKITDGTHDTPERLKQGIKFITGKHIRPYVIDFENSDYVTEEVHKEIYRRCNPEFGDILYTNIGVNLGTAAMNTVSFEFSMKNVALLKLKQALITSRYLEHFLNLPSRRNRILELNSSGGAQQFLSLGQIKNIDIPVPPMELQKTFSEIVEKTEILKGQFKNSLNDLENLFDSLSQKAFKGELVIDTLKLGQSIDGEMLELEHSRSIGMQILSDGLPENAVASFQKEVEELTAEIEKRRILINLLSGAVSGQKKKESDSEQLEKAKKELRTKTVSGKPIEVPAEKKIEIPKKGTRKSKLTWDRVSTEQVANWIKENYSGYHFTSEMLIRFLTDEHVTFPDYYSSEELKKNPKANDADDLKTLIFSSLNNENPFLKLEQVFYNPELDNVNLTLKDEDFELIKNRTRQERTGVYLRIAK